MRVSAKTSASTAALLATLAVLVLLILTDTSPAVVTSFEDIPRDGRSVQVPCIAVSSREAKGGFILDLRDAKGISMNAYCPDEKMVNMTFPCTVVVKGQMDDGEEPFMFIDKIVPRS